MSMPPRPAAERALFSSFSRRRCCRRRSRRWRVSSSTAWRLWRRCCPRRSPLRLSCREARRGATGTASAGRSSATGVAFTGVTTPAARLAFDSRSRCMPASSRVMGWMGLMRLAGRLAACSVTGGKKATGVAGLPLSPIVSAAEVARMAPTDQIRYFTDNVYLASINRDDARAEAAEATWRHLQGVLSKEEFVQFWTGVDNEFFARVNAVLDYPDYTHRQVPLDQRRMRTAYNLGARHLEALKGLGEARQQAMRDVIELAAKGDSAACFAFHKAYKDY